ncbi:hypothetical protein J7J18_04850 [bacterium]|nr:hypothetical protein [bacterium]
MKFSLNLAELYNNMADEYDVPAEEYINYKTFVEYAKRHGFKIVESKYGDYIVLEIPEIDEESEEG